MDGGCVSPHQGLLCWCCLHHSCLFSEKLIAKEAEEEGKKEGETEALTERACSSHIAARMGAWIKEGPFALKVMAFIGGGFLFLSCVFRQSWHRSCGVRDVIFLLLLCTGQASTQ